MQPRRQRRSGEVQKRTSRSESPDIVYDVTNEEGPPDNERQEYGQDYTHVIILIVNGTTPAQPVCGQNSQPDDNKILLEIEEAHRVPMTVTFQIRLNIDFEIQVDDRAEHPRCQIQKDDGIGETLGWYRSKVTEERMGLGVGWRANC